MVCEYSIAVEMIDVAKKNSVWHLMKIESFSLGQLGLICNVIGFSHLKAVCSLSCLP